MKNKSTFYQKILISRGEIQRKSRVWLCSAKLVFYKSYIGQKSSYIPYIVYRRFVFDPDPNKELKKWSTFATGRKKYLL